MKRFVVPFLAVLSLLVPLTATAQILTGSDIDGRMQWDQVTFRNTSAATGVTVRDPFWPRQGVSPTGFVDSTVFRHGSGTTTAAHYDTTIAYRLSSFGWPPNVGRTTGATVDSSSNTPWIIFLVYQDSTSVAFTSPTRMDSLRIGAEISINGIDWHGVRGTPTRAFDVDFFVASASDGVANTSLVMGPLGTVMDAAAAYLGCAPGGGLGTAPIINKTLCQCEVYVRFIIGGNDHTGQFAAKIGSWRHP